ncbi:TetR/AcrR family transcriptional regulator [Neofamilia massiliensis]|uniref:TetR/AcrR family transcriptional regulator n=1 Tax=Neofamilia massiliensis TaxID=1673724 RepID=UPI0006BB6802|nr:TetR/AcrR family transcriptional regulator [Neofamilia massiliensis]
MDRRQEKTRQAIFTAFSFLLEEKNYNKITVQEIIDKANIGRSTFYAHFETKDQLLSEICQELFSHVLETAVDKNSVTGLYSQKSAPKSVFSHLLQHLEKNDHKILSLLACESNEIFLRYFKDSLKNLIKSQYINLQERKNKNVPEDFLINHISTSFVEMILWWIKDGKKYPAKDLDKYFKAVIDPIL